MAALSAERALVSFESPRASRRRVGSRTETATGELSAPIRSGGRLIGVLVVSERTRGGEFTPEEVNLLGALAEVAGRARLWPL